MPTKISVDLIENHNAIKNLGRFDDIRPYLLASEETIEREFSPLKSVKDNYPKLVLSMDINMVRGTMRGL